MFSIPFFKLLWVVVPFLLAASLFRRRSVKKDLKAFDPLKAALVCGGVMASLLFLMLCIPFYTDSLWEVRRIWWSWFGEFPDRKIAVIAALVLGLIAARMRGRSYQRLRWITALPLLCWVIVSTPQSDLVVLNRFRPPQWSNGVCLQSTGFTCAPAAAATLLYAYHIQTDESEMAARCATSSAGTYMADVAQGLGAMLPSDQYTVCCCHLTPRELTHVHLPCITSNTAGRYYHAWVIFRFMPDGTMEVGEGGYGRQFVRWSDFASHYCGVAVVVIPKDKPSVEASEVYSVAERSGRIIVSIGAMPGER